MRETESEWEALWGWGIQEVNISDQIDQLSALRFEMQSGKFNLDRSKSDEISENEMPRRRK